MKIIFHSDDMKCKEEVFLPLILMSSECKTNFLNIRMDEIEKKVIKESNFYCHK